MEKRWQKQKFFRCLSLLKMERFCSWDRSTRPWTDRDHTEVKSRRKSCDSLAWLTAIPTWVYGGSRERELVKTSRCFTDILAQGGGILWARFATREVFCTISMTSPNDCWITCCVMGDTVEAKSGYGLIGKMENASWMLKVLTVIIK